MAGAILGVLPHNAGIFLVQTHRLLDSEGLTCTFSYFIRELNEIANILQLKRLAFQLDSCRGSEQ